VTPQGRPKSLSRESAFTEATADSEAKQEKVSALAADVAARAQSRGAMYRTIGIKVVTPPFDINTRASSLSGPVDEPDLVESVALDLLEEFADDQVRKLGVRVSNLDFESQDQVRLDGFESTDGGGGSATERDMEPVETVDTSGGRITDWIEDGESTESNEERTVREGQSSLGEFE
jgi:DNA polymerase IV (DinB-like DNA polymerase)